MPTYRVDTPRFYNGSLHGPNERRKTITTDKPLKNKKGNTPEGLTLIPASKATTKQANKSTAVAAKAKAEQEKDIQGMTFLDPPKDVETL